jgi:hypothetical protein
MTENISRRFRNKNISIKANMIQTKIIATSYKSIEKGMNIFNSRKVNTSTMLLK